MKRVLLISIFALLGIVTQASELDVVPTVAQWKASKGVFAISSATTVKAESTTLSYAADYLSSALELMQHKKANAPATSVVLQLIKAKKGSNEAYTIKIKKEEVIIQGATPQAIMWGIQTLLQMEKSGAEIPCGTITDQPDYALRGFMIDCGRKYIPLDYLRSLVRTMSYYKMNTLQVHLNDNGFKKYFHNNWDETYAAFRIESELFPELTAKDGYYSKKEFREFVLESEKLGVEIIPEIDAPAHALAFTHFRPSLGCEEFGVDHFDLTNPEVVPFLDSLWTEYLSGPEPIFAGPRVHIGTDEYSNKKQEVVELFRGLTDHLIKLVESYNKQAVVWGSLTYAKGETPVQVKNVLMDMWSNGFADPKEMHDAGYQMVSIPDGYVYIVPAAGYYYDYLYDQMLYEHWTPANIGGTVFPEKDPQIEGGMFAVWNDVCGNGISVGDIHHRTFPALQVIAQKTWHAVNDTVGYARWNEGRKNLGEGPMVNELGNNECYVKELKAGQKIVESGLGQIGYDYQVDFDITWGNEPEGATLTESARAKFYLSDPISGMLGYSRDGYLFTFNYSGRAGRTEHITIKGTNKETSLSINGKLVQTLGYDEHIAADMKPYSVVRTLVFPLQNGGAFKSVIRNFSARKL